jgi:hypothetical protein
MGRPRGVWGGQVTPLLLVLLTVLTLLAAPAGGDASESAPPPATHDASGGARACAWEGTTVGFGVDAESGVVKDPLWTPLHEAARRDDVDAVTAALSKKVCFGNGCLGLELGEAPE